MPGPIVVNPTPSWLKPENASVTDSALTKALRMIGSLIGADNPTAQVMGLMMTEVPGGEATGGLAKAVKGLKERAIKAYHGSPHDFEQFSLSKIGTGEGAQAYGHGLYFAENPETAAAYRKMLSTPRVEVAGKPVDAAGDRATDIALAHLESAAQESADRAETFLKARKSISQMQYDAPPEMRPVWSAARQRIDELEAQGATVGKGGKTYEVAIKADPEDFLDWDKPLSQQSEKVKAFMKDVETSPGLISVTDADGTARHYRLGEDRNKMTGAGLYSASGKLNGSDVAATDAMKQAGIPGIKYLDQGSRAAGEGSRNYVVFDDKLIDILKKYGLLLPAAGGVSQLDTK